MSHSPLYRPSETLHQASWHNHLKYCHQTDHLAVPDTHSHHFRVKFAAHRHSSYFCVISAGWLETSGSWLQTQKHRIFNTSRLKVIYTLNTTRRYSESNTAKMRCLSSISHYTGSSSSLFIIVPGLEAGWSGDWSPGRTRDFWSIRFLWPCIVNIRWRERTNKMQLIWSLLSNFLSQHVSGIIMPIIRRIRPCPTACGVLPGCVGCG